MPTFPAEVILQVVESLIPPISRKIHSPGDAVTKTLINLTLACKLTYRTARQLLFRHCLYIDSIVRLDSLLDKSCYFVDNDTDGPESYSLFLAPFPEATLDERTVRQIVRLFARICSSVRNLVINIPLRSLYPEDDAEGIRKSLREAFRGLKMLEEVCSVQDELFLRAIDEIEPEVWPMWHRLRHLALYNPNIDSQFVEELQRCPNLTHLVLMRPDSYMYEAIPESLAESLPLGLKRVVVANTREGHLIDAGARSSQEASVWKSSFWGRMMLSQYSEETVEEKELLFHADVPWNPKQEMDDIYVCQEWLLAHAVDGTLWEVPGMHCLYGTCTE